MSLIESPPLAGAALANRTDPTWTDEREALLRRLWLADELRAREIAEEIGGFENCILGGKNAVIGKARRLGLKAHSNKKGTGGSRLPRRPGKPKAQTRHTVTHLQKRKAEALEGPFVEVAPEAVAFIPAASPCSLLELDDAKCHWPIGDPGAPDFHFCGGKAPGAKPYCAGHCHISYQPPASRRDRRPVPA